MAAEKEDPGFQHLGARPKSSAAGEVTDPNPQLVQQGQTKSQSGKIEGGPPILQPGQKTFAMAASGNPPTISGRARSQSGQQFDPKAFLNQHQYAHLTLLPTDSAETQQLKTATADAMVAAEIARREAMFYRDAVKRQTDEKVADQKAHDDQIAQMAAQIQNVTVGPQNPPQFLQPPPTNSNPVNTPQYHGHNYCPSVQPASGNFTVNLSQPPVVNNLNNSGNLSINSQSYSQNITMATPQEEHINTMKQLLDQEFLTLTVQAQNLEFMFQSLANSAVPPTQAQIQSYNNMTDRVTKGLADVDAKKAALTHTKSVAETFKTSLRMPQLALTEANYTDAMRKKLEGKSVISAIKKFNPDKDPEADFTDTWNHILLYTKGFTLTASSYLDILLCLVEGNAYRSLMDMTNSNQSLPEILKTLCCLYSKRKTMLDLIQNINDFTRYANEIIEKTMSRATIVVEKVKDNFPPSEWKSNKDRMLQSILSQVISKATKAHLDAEERKCLRVGAQMSYQSKLDTVDTFEHANNELPRHSVATVINACTGTPIDSRLNFDGNKSYFQINAVVPADKRTDMKAKSRERRVSGHIRERRASGNRDRAAQSREGATTPFELDDWDMELARDIQTRERARQALYEQANQAAREKSIERPGSRARTPFKKSVRSLSRSSGRARSSGKEQDGRECCDYVHKLS